MCTLKKQWIACPGYVRGLIKKGKSSEKLKWLKVTNVTLGYLWKILWKGDTIRMVRFHYLLDTGQNERI